MVMITIIVDLSPHLAAALAAADDDDVELGGVSSISVSTTFLNLVVLYSLFVLH